MQVELPTPRKQAERTAMTVRVRDDLRNAVRQVMEEQGLKWHHVIEWGLLAYLAEVKPSLAKRLGAPGS